MSSFYAVYHGPKGLRTIASRIQRLTAILAAQLETLGFASSNQSFFDTLTLPTNGQQDVIYQRALDAGYNLRKVGTDSLGISLDENPPKHIIFKPYLTFFQGRK